MTLINDDKAKELVVNSITVLQQPAATLIVSPAHSGTGAFTTNISPYGATPVDITTPSDIVLQGTISNPQGSTTVTALGGPINGTTGQLISSQTVTLTANTIGSSANRVGVQMVQYSGAPSLTATAAGNVYLDLSALNLANTSQSAVLNSGSFAGQTVDLLFQDSGSMSAYDFAVAATELDADAGVNTPVDLTFTAMGDLPVGLDHFTQGRCQPHGRRCDQGDSRQRRHRHCGQ